MAERKVILASESPTRARLLAAAGVDFVAKPASLDERSIEAPLIMNGAQPAAIAVALAEAKAVSVSTTHPQALVIGADQTLALDQQRWTKPGSRDDAMRQLATLAERDHHLHSGVAMARAGRILDRHVETATLTMRALTQAEIEAYLDAVGDDAYGSVGGYQIEGRGIQLFDRIHGDFFSILGLPLLVVLAWLRREGGL